ncbi:MAG: hypothetical protein ACK5DE_14000 [Bacteroidota bacterium]|jgi:hypothetical protein
MKITIKDNPGAQGGFWEAYYEEKCITVSYYHDESLKHEKLFECISKAKAKLITIEIEMNFGIDQVTPV